MYQQFLCWFFMEVSASCSAEADSSCPSAQHSGKGTFARIIPLDTMIMVSIFVLALADAAALAAVVLFGLMILGAADKVILALTQQEMRPKEQPLTIL